MGWKTKSVMEQKLLFIKMWQSENYTMTALCDRFDISRTTGHKLVNRFELDGEKSLVVDSKKPHGNPQKTSQKTENLIIKIRKKYPDWGARKLKVLLEERYPKKKFPSETTFNAILKRNNLIKPKRRRNPKEGKLNPKFDPSEPNEIWSADYKGKFKIGNKRYCWPLTICDSNSRIILGIFCHYSPDFKSVKQAYIKVFKKYGLPKFIHTDNGTPFGSMRSPRRFSKLCYWLIDLGITPVFSDPASPQQNGRHERMHKDLKAYCRNRIQKTLSKQQIIMNDFVREYNNVRPHESLEMNKPAKVHVLSEIKYSSKIDHIQYPLHYKVIKVTSNGAARWGAYNWVLISRAAIGRFIGTEEIGNGIWNVYYRDVLLGWIDEKAIRTKETYLHIKRIKV